MKESFNKKRIILLMLMISAIFILSGCYMTPPDDISGIDTGLDGVFVPYTTAPPTPSPSPSPDPTQTALLPSSTVNPWSGNNPFVSSSPTDSIGQPQDGTTTSLAPGRTAPVLPTNTAPARTAPASTQKAATATPKPTSSTLGVGSSGDKVKKVQSRLKELGYYKGSVDGNFGSNTETAVKDFQKTNGLSSDGRVGKDTQSKLDSSSAKKKTTSTTATSTSKVTATPRPTATPNLTKETYFQIGSSGKSVTQLQQRLISLGYLTGKADGDYGYRTEAAVKAYQKRAGIWDDGVAGPDTQKSLYGNSAKKANVAVAHIGEPLKEGAKSAGVRSMQKKLADLGYLKSGEADGVYGANTKNAVMYFQQQNGLTPVDGAAGDKTLELLYSGNAIKYDGTGGDSGGDDISSDGYITLRPGEATGAQVKKLQDKLQNLGYYTGSSDGKYGSGTTEAVRTFQLRNGLKIDGVAGPATQRLMYGDTGVNPNRFSPLRQNDQGKAVRTMQSTLTELGYYQGKIDGVYGESTALAVREFQSNNGLTVDGTAGRETLAIMFSSYAKGASKNTATYRKLSVGMTGDDVVLLQDKLKRLNYYSENINATYDEYTKWAVEKFQGRNGLKIDGIAGEETQRKLYSGSAVANN